MIILYSIIYTKIHSSTYMREFASKSDITNLTILESMQIYKISLKAFFF